MSHPSPSLASVHTVEIYCWDRHVGSITQEENGDFYTLQYSPQWIEQGFQLAPLHAPNQLDAHVFHGLSSHVYHRLPAFIADSLPDQFGLRLIDLWLRRQGVVDRYAHATPLERLLFMGSRAMGALEFRPTFGPGHHAKTMEVEELVHDAHLVPLQDEQIPIERLDNLMEVGASAGGQRAKAVIGWNATSNKIISGQPLILPEGFSHWLIKLDGVVPISKEGALELGVSQGWGRVEYAYSEMARAAGINISQCRLLEENGRAHFMTRRFDRPEEGKLHIQTLCAMDHLDYTKRCTHTYESLFSAITRLELGEAALEEAFRRMAFNIMGRNHDDHTKNFSFLMRPSGQWELSPGYDITYANNPTSEWVYQHLMSANGKFKDHERTDLVRVGEAWGVPGIQSVLDQVAAAIAQWNKFSQDACVDAALSATIQSELRLL